MSSHKNSEVLESSLPLCSSLCVVFEMGLNAKRLRRKAARLRLPSRYHTAVMSCSAKGGRAYPLNTSPPTLPRTRSAMWGRHSGAARIIKALLPTPAKNRHIHAHSKGRESTLHTKKLSVIMQKLICAMRSILVYLLRIFTQNAPKI